MHGIHIVWFKRDLRLHDHQPLVEAAAMGMVLPLYVVEPEALRQADAAPRHWHFVWQSLGELDQALKELSGSGLVLRVGEIIPVLAAIHRKTSILGLWSHQETGNAWSYARDRSVGIWTRKQGIPWREYQQNGVVRGLKSRNGWSTAWKKFTSASLILSPDNLTVAPISSDPWPQVQKQVQALFNTRPDACSKAQTGGRREAMRLLENFLQRRAADYARGMSSPLSAASVCSRLSPHLAYGTISVREIINAIKNQDLTKEKGWARNMRALEARLAWRSHFIQKLESEPELEFRNLHPALADQRQHIDPILFSAWTQGQTGFPLVDACMRMLHATGWINFRMRAMLAAFACYHLWQPWQAAGLHLARLFIDYEPGIHWSQMQMQSGSTGINAFRIYNPVKQSYEQDPSGQFIRRWIPELAQVPKDWIHEPWRMPEMIQQTYQCRIGVDYPLPIVDHEKAARVARQRLRQAYGGPQARAQSREILDRHGSRKSKARKSPSSSQQLCLFE